MQPIVLVFFLLSSVLQCIEGHTPLASVANNSCLVPVVCGYPPSTQWRSMETAGLRGDRGPTGKKGPRGIPGKDAPSNQDRISNLTERIAQVEANNRVLSDHLLQAHAAIHHLTESSWTDGFTPGNGFQYKVVTGTSSRREGQTACYKIGSKVATVGMRNQTSYNLIMAGLTLGVSTQIGLSDLAEEGHFVWDDGVTASSGWTNWRANEPNNALGAEDCVQIDAGLKTWNDIRCSSLNGVLCERSVAFL